jgi:hypothetical protein
MTQTTIPPILGKLSHDILLIGTTAGVIQEANDLAFHLFGEDILGKSFLTLMSPKSSTKGERFFAQVQGFQVGEVSNTWELFFKTLETDTLLVNTRAGLIQVGVWVMMGACEPPQLTTIYHEVLAMNSELTNLIRRLSKDQARLTSRLNNLLDQE